MDKTSETKPDKSSSQKPQDKESLWLKLFAPKQGDNPDEPRNPPTPCTIK